MSQQNLPAREHNQNQIRKAVRALESELTNAVGNPRQAGRGGMVTVRVPFNSGKIGKIKSGTEHEVD